MSDDEKLYPKDAVYAAAMTILLNVEPLESDPNYVCVSIKHINALGLAISRTTTPVTNH